MTDTLADPFRNTIIVFMPDESLLAMLQLAERLAREAAGISLARRGRAVSHRKQDRSLVTDVDLEIETVIIEAVAEVYPDHAVLGEEGHAQSKSTQDPQQVRYTWVVDPIDGTRNYVVGFPCFSTAIGVLDQGKPIVGVVFEHNLGHLYTAVAGAGAWFNGEPMKVVDPSEGEDRLVGAPSTKDALTIGVLSRWLTMPGLVYRNVGSTAVQLAMVASGVLSAAYAKRSKIWDVAAGALIVTEAGGLFTDPSGRERLPFDLSVDPEEDLPFLSAAPQTHAHLLASIADIVSGS